MMWTTFLENADVTMVSEGKLISVDMSFVDASVKPYFFFWLQAKYRDPQTRMLYSTSEEFLTIRSLPMDIIGGYLTLRKASPT